jgi:hypothetical protein
VDTAGGVILVLGSQDERLPDVHTVSMERGQPLFADLDRDGKQDLVLQTRLHVLVLLGNGDGTLAPPRLYVGGSRDPFLLAGDLTGDGRTDLVSELLALMNLPN